jgi:CheY-like chemotaxis protein
MTERICLIVDDEPAIRTYLSAVLRQRGIQCLEADGAAEALRILHKLGGQIDLLLTDIQMPGEMDGLDLAYSVRNSFSALPVIVVSGHIDRAPADFTVVQKPFLPGEILKAIDKVMLRPYEPRGAQSEVPGANSDGPS